MQRYFPPTEYPLEYVSYFSSYDSPFHIFGENLSLPDSANGYMHYHNLFQLGHCVSGNGIFLIENKIFPVAPGDCVFIPSYTIHSSGCIDGSECVFRFCAFSPDQLFSMAQFNYSFALELFSQNSWRSRGRAFSPVDGECHRLIRELVREAGSGSDNEYALCSLYLSEFFIHASRIGDSADTGCDERDFYAILPSIKEIMMRFGDHINPQHLAQICSLSETHFTRLFRKCCGMSPYDFLLDVRTRAGKSLLESTDGKIAHISKSIGFGNTSDFYRQFIKRFGTSPSSCKAKSEPVQ